MSEQLINTPCLFGETGNLLLERELGRGGMGGVYMGRDKMLDRAVAVKVMLKEYGSDAEFVEKFKREAQSAAKLIHPNIAQIYSYGISDGMPYIAMELVAGGSLYSLMGNSPGGTDVARVLKICEQVAQALRCASDQGVVHGDIKPENILLDSNGNAKLVDFGLAAMQKDTDEIWGTPYYIAPEKVRKEVVDYRADIYSLGGTLYHALTGVAPFEGEDAAAVVRKRFEGPCRKPSEVRPGLSPQVDALVMKMLAFDRNDRFPTFEALLKAFTTVMTTGLAAPSAEGQSGPAKRKLTVKRPGAKRFKVRDNSQDDDEEDAPPSRMSRAMEDVEEEDPDSGKLRNTVLAVIGGIVVVGGLLGFYVHHDRKVREAETRRQTLEKFENARESIARTAKAAEEYQKKFDDFAEKAINECQSSTDELAKLFPANIASMLKPPMTKELIDAMAAVKEGAEGEEAAGETNAPPKAVQQPASPQTAPRPAAPRRTASGFRPPQGDELDQNSPEYKDYLKAKAEWEAKHPAGAADGEAAPAEAPAGEAAQQEDGAAAAAASLQAPPPELGKVHELWERAYSCKACALIIHHRIDKLIIRTVEARQRIDSLSSRFEGDQPLPPEDEIDQIMAQVGDLSQSVFDEYESIKGSEEFTKVQKGISFIKSRGARTVEETMKRLRSERLEAERKAQKAAEEKAEKQRQKDLAEKKKKLIEDETKAINDKFEALTTAGVFRQLDWAGAKRQLNAMKGDFDSAEAAVVADLVIRKVEAMQLVHEIMIRNLKNYTFEKGKELKGMKVIEVDEREMKLLKKDGKSTKKVNWPKFYREYHGNLNELFNTFVVRGRKNGTPKLRPKDWSVAMMGAALTMRVICADDPAAPARGTSIAKEAVRQFEIYRPLAQEFFPDIDFSDVKPEE